MIRLGFDQGLQDINYRFLALERTQLENFSQSRISDPINS